MSSEIFDNFPVIDLGDYILGEIKEKYVADFYKYIMHKKVSAYLSQDDLPSSITAAKDELMYWARLFNYRSSIYWAILTKSDNLIGTCGFNSWNTSQRRAELSYDLSYNYWGKGIMTKAIKAVCDFGINQMQVMRIQATIVTDNERSIKLVKRLNFQKEGLLKNYANLKGTQKDSYMYSLIK